MRPLPAVFFLALSLQQPSTLAAGVAAMNDGDAAKAVTLLEQAVESEPASTLVLFHLANAQVATRNADAAIASLKRVLRINPHEKLALWNLAMLLIPRPGPAGDEGLSYLRQLIDLDQRHPHALSALATVQTMRARMQFMAAKRAANVRAEDQGWIADPAPRAAMRAAAWPALDQAQATSEQARNVDPSAFEPLVFIGLVLRMKAEIADDTESSARHVERAEQLTAQSLTLRRQQPPPPRTTGKLDPAVPPPAFPKPPAPPPPPPR